jgi:glycosyltransferase involved in cell wall biosynthesis
MKISVVVPVYNVAPYVWDCLWSVGQQDYPDMECLIIDDCSTDGSMAVVHDFLAQYKGHVAFRVISQPENRGLSEARNIGLEHSAGDFVYFLDSDDKMSSGCISLLVNVQKQKSADVVIGGHQFVRHDGSTVNVIPLTRGNIFLASEKYWPAIACNKLVSKHFLDQNHIRFTPGIYHEDILWTYQLLLHSPKIAFCQEITYYYLERSSSIMNTHSQAVIDKRYESYKLILDAMKAEMPTDLCLYTGALLLTERTARMMACEMLLLNQKDKARWLFDFARNQIKIPLGCLISSSDVLMSDKLKLIYRLFPQKWAFGIFSLFYSHHR